MVRRDVTRCLQIIVSQGTSQGAPQAGAKTSHIFVSARISKSKHTTTS